MRPLTGTLLSLGLALSACGGGGPTDASSPLRGHFSTNATAGGDYTLAVFVSSANGVISGYGWGGVPGGTNPPIEPLTVSGQQTGRAISLTLAPASDGGASGLYGIFNGRNESGQLVGTLSRSSQSIGVTFIPTDTTASGRFDLATTGGQTVALAGRAGFATAGGFKLDLLATGGSAPVLSVSGAGRPSGGAATVGTTYQATLRLPGGPSAPATGTLQLDRSSPLLLIGRFDGQATVNGAAVGVQVRFSAGCPTVCN